jgi:hypothetical protein
LTQDPSPFGPGCVVVCVCVCVCVCVRGVLTRLSDRDVWWCVCVCVCVCVSGGS